MEELEWVSSPSLSRDALGHALWFIVAGQVRCCNPECGKWRAVSRSMYPEPVFGKRKVDKFDAVCCDSQAMKLTCTCFGLFIYFYFVPPLFCSFIFCSFLFFVFWLCMCTSQMWYCAMNAMDETVASCAAPQEPLWNCDWNLRKLRPSERNGVFNDYNDDDDGDDDDGENRCTADDVRATLAMLRRELAGAR